MASSTLRTAINSRQVYIRMQPAPRTLSQSRAVLKSLQQFGEVSSFLNTKYFKIRTSTSGGTAFVIFESPESASNAIRASPLTVPLSNPRQSTSNSHIQEHPSSSNPAENAMLHPSDTSGEIIECTITESEYDHKANMRKNPYNMGFQISRHWMEVQDLMRAPDNRAPLAEYADCFTKRKFSMPFRVQDRYFENTVKAGGTSLMQMWKQGLEEEKRKKEEDAKRLDAERPQQNADSG
ncbi:hypothetical protein GTR04_4001 [Trichophyton interdigitale]|uniref:RRM domain-containing protein n=1 Tax=Trichophyton interdigitale TaxID=101480 RepID=A0A9P4YHW8_9EURO|nr:hypothetical protein GY631_4878 [Trichophyton interdigitale]KAF3895003.1 hypothetical protein GY632_3468 [Trichophyton interdigitale]KAG8208600.1 hypothetical protein GTR04_4001 [Trichophyton interdigitale]